MSDNLVIAETTVGLAQIVSDALGAVMPGARTTTLAPAAEALRSGDPIANIHLLAAEPAPISRTPTRRGPAPAPLLLRLTFFICFFGDDSRQVQQKLMGAVAAALHAQPLLPGIAGSPRISPVSLGAERMAALAAALGSPGLTGLVYEVSPVSL